MRVGHETGAQEADPVDNRVHDDETKTDPMAKLTGSRARDLFVRHCHAMMVKRAKYCLRDCQSWFCQLVLPLILLVLGVVMYKVSQWGFCI